MTSSPSPPTYDPDWQGDGDEEGVQDMSDTTALTLETDTANDTVKNNKDGGVEPASYDTIITVQPEPQRDGHIAETQPLTEISISADSGTRDRQVSFTPILGCEECIRTQDEPNLTEARGYGRVVTTSGTTLKGDQFMQQEDHPLPKTDARDKRFCFFRCGSTILHIGVFICIIMLLWIHFTRKQMFIEENRYNMYLLEMGLTGAFGLLGYILIIAELANSEATPYMMNIKNLEEVNKYTHGLRHSKPKVMVCVTTYTSSTYRGVTNHNVVAYREKRELPITRWKDFSKELDVSKQLRMNSIVKLRLKSTVCFMDEATLQEYEAIASTLYDQAARVPGNRVELEPYMKIAGFKRRIAIYPDSGGCSKFCTALWYWLTGFILCTCPFRCWFDLRSAKAHYTVAKVVGV